MPKNQEEPILCTHAEDSISNDLPAAAEDQIVHHEEADLEDVVLIVEF